VNSVTDINSLVEIPVLSPAPVRWPSPPFFQSAAPVSSGEARSCELTLTDGRVLSGELTRFEPHEDVVELRVPQRMQPVRVHLDRVRWIKRAQPEALIPDEAALAALGTTPPAASGRRDLSISLQDGSRLEGRTQGFAKEKAGLFVFLVEDSSALVVPCFVPVRQIKNLRIGPLLGDTLVNRQIVSREALATALEQQSRLRTERIGEYLTERAIVSREDLQRALLEQKRRPTARLGDVLVEAKLITADQLQRALAIQAEHRERRLGDILIEMDAVSLQLIQVALADKLGIPYVNVRNFGLELAALRLVDPAFAVRKGILPLLHTAESLVIAVENPLAMDFAQDLRFATSLTIVPVIADPAELKARIAKEYSRLHARSAASAATSVSGKDSNKESSNRSARAEVKVEELAVQLNKETPQPRVAEKLHETDARVSENTLVRLINKIIVEAYEQGTSDIHIESNPGQGNIRIRFRKDGELEDYLELPPTYRSALISRIKIMSDLDISEHRQPQDGKIEFAKHGPVAIELRVAIIPTVNGLEDVVLRILAAAEPRPLGALGFAARDLAELQKIITRTYGLILVCGPTGSGKTTTLHSVLAHVNQPDVKIWTAEDPVEISQPGLRQVQVQPKIGWTFAAAMRAFLRADPDVIMVGEMRDTETAKIGVEASLTGHLVFSTLHTNSAAESIVRLLDMGMDPFNFSDALLGILGQRLARRLCTQCKRSRSVSEKEISALAAEYCGETRLDCAEVSRQWRHDYAVNGCFMLYEAVGCQACRSGYDGRVGIYELLVATPRLKDLIRSRAPVPQLVEVACEGGMRLLRQDAIDKVLQGVLDLSAARAASS
jgi:type II secretory ATPase GspE/PulE/Tfp pilus assembly ATPase PilB-like protein